MTPIKNMARTATASWSRRAAAAAGDEALLLYESANFDDAQFAARRFDIERSPNDHVAFGFGAHFCSGRAWPASSSVDVRTAPCGACPISSSRPTPLLAGRSTGSQQCPSGLPRPGAPTAPWANPSFSASVVSSLGWARHAAVRRASSDRRGATARPCSPDARSRSDMSRRGCSDCGRAFPTAPTDHPVARRAPGTVSIVTTSGSTSSSSSQANGAETLASGRALHRPRAEHGLVRCVLVEVDEDPFAVFFLPPRCP